MAQLLLIGSKSLSLRDNREVNDLVGVFEDSHVFSPHETKIFKIVKIDGKREEIEKNAIYPEVRVAVKDEGFETWSLNDGMTLSTEKESKEVWNDSGQWRELKIMPRFPLRYDSPSKEIKENFSRYSENKISSVIIQEADNSGD